MKQRIFNRGNGWYISATNYKNKEDKAYMNVKFRVCEEPPYIPPAGNDFTFIDIDIKEQRYNSYQKKMELTVFKYEIIKPNDGLTEIEKDNKDYAESIQGTAYEKKYGNHGIDLSPDDLPFY